MKLLATSLSALVLLVPAAAMADETPTPAPAPTQVAAAPGPIVELTADEPNATIERRASTTSPTVPLLETGVLSVGHWEHTCVAPCQMKLDPRYAYRVAGDGLVPTSSFAIPRGQDQVRVEAKMGSSTGRVAGVLGTVGGVMAIAAGGLALAATPILESEDVGSKGFRSAMLVGGVTVASIGIISTAVGLYLWLSNGSTVRTETPLPSAPYASSAAQASR